jgi:hypothetical protein
MVQRTSAATATATIDGLHECPGTLARP